MENAKISRIEYIFELGYFAARLDRGHVAAIKKGDIEVHSDYSGIIYISYNDKGRWQFGLTKEMKSAGLPVDLNRLYLS